MTKPPETRDRFQISAQASTERVGELLATLTRMGFENISYDIITDVVTFKRNGAKRNGEAPATAPAIKRDDSGSATEFVGAYIAEHPSFHISELKAAFASRGWSENNAYKIANDLAKAGILRKLDPSNYSRADIKALAPPKPAKPAGQKSPHSVANLAARYDVSNRDLMLLSVGKRKTVTIAGMRAWLVDNGRPEKSASPMLFKMTKEGLFKTTGEMGEYEVTEMGHKEARRIRDGAARKQKQSSSEVSADAPETDHA